MAKLCQDKGLTQKQLARVRSVFNGTISNYENGVHYPEQHGRLHTLLWKI